MRQEKDGSFFFSSSFSLFLSLSLSLPPSYVDLPATSLGRQSQSSRSVRIQKGEKREETEEEVEEERDRRGRRNGSAERESGARPGRALAAAAALGCRSLTFLLLLLLRGRSFARDASEGLLTMSKKKQKRRGRRKRAREERAVSSFFSLFFL